MSNFIKTVENLKNLFGIIKDVDLYKKIGVTKNTFYTWKDRGNIPDAALFKIAENTGFSIGEIQGKEGIGPKIIQPLIHLVGQVEKAPDPKRVKIEDYYAAPLVDGKIAAGPGRIPTEEVKSLVWIYAPELRSRRTHRLVAVQLANDATSMSPTLEPGDIVLIDRDDPRSASDFKSGKIYAARMGRHDEGCAIKRLDSDDGGIIISSDNRKDSPPIRSWTADLHKLIVGRVVWGWRNLLEA